jgi:hypothetical protein
VPEAHTFRISRFSQARFPAIPNPPMRRRVYGEVCHGETYIDPAELPRVEDPPPDPEPERKLPPKENGIYRHTADCDCWICGDNEGVA